MKVSREVRVERVRPAGKGKHVNMRCELEKGNTSRGDAEGIMLPLNRRREVGGEMEQDEAGLARCMERRQHSF